MVWTAIFIAVVMVMLIYVLGSAISVLRQAVRYELAVMVAMERRDGALAKKPAEPIRIGK